MAGLSKRLRERAVSPPWLMSVKVPDPPLPEVAAFRVFRHGRIRVFGDINGSRMRALGWEPDSGTRGARTVSVAVRK